MSNSLETTLLAHRYLYYVLAEPVISDYIYDVLEAEGRKSLPPESPIQGVGSSLPSSYSPEVVALALQMLG